MGLPWLVAAPCTWLLLQVPAPMCRSLGRSCHIVAAHATLLGTQDALEASEKAAAELREELAALQKRSADEAAAEKAAHEVEVTRLKHEHGKLQVRAKSAKRGPG